MSSIEKHWTLKSANLRKIKDSGKRSVLKRTKSRNSSIQSDSTTTSSQHNHTDIRKLSYSVLPNPPLFNKSEYRNNENNNWETESNNSETSTFYQPLDVPSVIDNTSYRNYLRNNRQNPYFNHNNESNISKQYVLKQRKQITRTTSKNGINLNVFHALQLVSFEIIDEALDDEIIPDVLIEVFKDIQYKAELFRQQIIPIVRSTAEHIMVEVIDQYIQETVLVTLLRDSKNQLQSQIILKWLMDDILSPFLVDIAKDALRDVANEKLVLSRLNYLSDKLITEFIDEELKNSEISIFKEVIFEETLEEYVIDPIIIESLRITGHNMITYYHEKVSRINLQQVNEMAVQKPLYGLIIDHLISVGSRQKMFYGSSFVGQYCFEYIVFDILLKKTYEIYDRLMNTVDCLSLCQWHQDINKSILTSNLINELFEHSDADLCDLDASEIEESYIPKFLENIDEIFYSKTK